MKITKENTRKNIEIWLKFINLWCGINEVTSTDDKRRKRSADKKLWERRHAQYREGWIGFFFYPTHWLNVIIILIRKYSFTFLVWNFCWVYNQYTQKWQMSRLIIRTIAPYIQYTHTQAVLKWKCFVILNTSIQSHSSR